MPLNSNALTTLAEAKSFLDIPTANTSADARIERFINAASDWIENYIARKIKSQTITEYHDGRLSNALLLRQWPAQKPTEVNIDGTWQFAAATKLAADEYDVNDEGWLMLRSSVFPRGTRNIKIVYVGGYSAVPSALEEACLMLVEYFYMHRNDRRSGVRSKSKNGENISYMDSIPGNITSMLDNYRRVEFPNSEAVVDNH